MSVMSVKSDRRNERTFIVLRGVVPRTKQGIRRAWFELGRHLKDEANREILRRPKGGRTYFIRSRSGGRRRHVASAPGETHANRSGALRRALSWKVNGTDSMDFGYQVAASGNPAPSYAPFVEFGTSRMAARPSLENAINASQRDAERIFVSELAKELNP